MEARIMNKWNQDLLLQYVLVVGQIRSLISAAAGGLDPIQLAAMIRKLDERRASLHDALLSATGLSRTDRMARVELAEYLDSVLEADGREAA
jgi:hypothetical protein